VAKSATSYLYLHRLMRVFNFLSEVKLYNNVPVTEFWKKSMMMSNLLVSSYSDKLQTEAGTLSYIPQYSKMKLKNVSRLFGQDVKNLVLETNRLGRRLSEDGDLTDAEVRGYSIYAKNIYLHQSYIDLVILFTTDHEDIVIDGELHKVRMKGDVRQIQHDGEWHKEEDFHQWFMEAIVWKKEQMEYCSGEIQQAILEAVKQYKEQKGFVFDLTGTFLEAGKDRSPVSTGDNG